MIIYSSPRLLLKVLMEEVSGPCSPRMSAGSSLLTTWHHLRPLLWLLIQENQWKIHCKWKVQKSWLTLFFHLLGEALQSVPTYRLCAHKRYVHSSMISYSMYVLFLLQALQMVWVDVTTACHLGLCIAVRLTEAVPLVNSREEIGEPRIFTNSQLESALWVSGLGKRSKQRFLCCSTRDSIIKSSRRGSGGNTSPCGCFVVKQSAILEMTISLLRQGIKVQHILSFKVKI